MEMYTDMGTVTLSTRLEEQEARRIDGLARELGMDRAALLKQLIRTGCAEMLTRRAVDAYRHGDVSLSRAAEIAGLTVRDLLLKLPEESVELNFDLRELQRDLAEA